MPALSSLMDLYGAIDQAAVRRDDPEIRATVNGLLPRAGQADGGWYAELKSLFPPSPEQEPEPSREREFFGEPPPNLNAPPAVHDVLDAIVRQGGEFTVPELSRLVYGIGTLTQVLTPDEMAAVREQLVRALALAAPADDGIRSDSRVVRADEFLDFLSTSFTDGQSWGHVIRMAKANGWLTPDVADVPLCLPSVVSIDGQECLVVDTVFTSNKVTLKNLKDVVSPANWHRNYPHFFCRMTEEPGNYADGWSRVLEKVGFCPEVWLTTALKYYKSEQSKNDARLDYDLDAVYASKGDGLVTVDRGYINMKSTAGDPDKPGVRVRTRKVVRIEGVLPDAQKAIVCLFGYGSAAMEMLFGNALRAHDPSEGFVPWGGPSPTPQVVGVTGGSADGKPSTPRSRIAATAVDLLNDCVQDLIGKNLELSQKWMDGKLDFAGLAEYTTAVGGRLASEPWRFLQALSETAASGPGTEPNGNDQGGGT